jgi:chaperone required for assembly of F1-ATPase
MLTKGKPQPMERPRRFYRTAEAGAVESGFGVLLDGRPVRTPAGARLVLPCEALAELLAMEWAAQGEDIVIAGMHATRLAFTAADAAPDAREAIAEGVASYAGSDLLCYFADSPKALLERQLAHWGPVLEWAERELDLHFNRAVGIIHQPQPAATVDRVRVLALELDDFALTGLAHAAGLLSSTVLALALERGELTGEAAFELSRLDESFQEERWGVDEDAAARTASLRAEAVTLERWFRALEQ